jgi:uncharacterized membrane protein YGL010W
LEEIHMSERLDALFEDYGRFHTQPGNKVCHYIGIPLIVFSSLGLLAEVTVATAGASRFDLAAIVAGLLVGYYFTVSPRLALGMAVAFGLLYLGAREVSIPVHLGLFGFGWVLQFVGHYAFEKRSPAFFKNLLHLLVGPLWVLARLSPRIFAAKFSSGVPPA